MTARSTAWLKNARGQKLFISNFEPQAPIARLFFHHGLAEHVSRYDKLFERMAGAGIAIHSFDAHGHGRSDPLDKTDRALVWKFKHLVGLWWLTVPDTGEEKVQDHGLHGKVDDYEAVVDNSIASRQKLPMFLAGHSMGGLVAAHLALGSMPGRWSGLILHSPALDIEWNTMLRVQARIGGVMSSLVPKARIVPAVRPEDMSQDPRVVKDYLSDPLNTVGNVCARTANELLVAFRQLSSQSKAITLPVYVGHGNRDKCTSLLASKRFVEAVSSKDATLHVYDGGFHELLHGPEWKDSADNMVRWMARRVPPSSSKL